MNAVPAPLVVTVVMDVRIVKAPVTSVVTVVEIYLFASSGLLDLVGINTEIISSNYDTVEKLSTLVNSFSSQSVTAPIVIPLISVSD